MWVLRSADGELRALLATYCDDQLILGIGKDAAATIDPLKDIVTYGDYTNLSEGHFVGVQFDVSTTGVFCHQHDYVASLVLPSDMAGSDRGADKPLPVGSTHEDDTSPLLSVAGMKVFRTLLGQDKACVVPLQAATDLVEQHRIGIFKIPTDSNLSDLLTKALDLGVLTHLMSPSPSLSSVFGSEIVSSLPPLALHDRTTMEKERKGDGEELTA
uniref:Reverse transcriptase Ty1/copia-type domain-containing protein n=1 Tax=Chromera velia CCMP2878 TaxID=1169474 RepID=A0A0G4IG85_9ALVE|eukprot:Cvel_14164.t1-p1 / transcript=Cvel_14164.t1 / gene=Cvel_14164 / organism=Chromera_velia_CCMP2878 / gene_product=hypothetical protein / transcript_product=hypothetical protein / location=Cvel_scaffold998:25456-26582(-) / protein_length=213 / sequence_SO=supercontig / SO=protein_coding / is_pseudo=false